MKKRLIIKSYLSNNFVISFMFFLNIIVSIILDIEYTVINIPREVVNAIVPILGLIIIIKPHIIDIIEHINSDIQLFILFLYSSIDSLKSNVDFVIIVIPATIGNNVLTISGLINIIIPSSNSITPNVKKLEKNILDSFSIKKYIPFTINNIDNI